MRSSGVCSPCAPSIVPGGAAIRHPRLGFDPFGLGLDRRGHVGIAPAHGDHGRPVEKPDGVANAGVSDRVQLDHADAGARIVEDHAITRGSVRLATEDGLPPRSSSGEAGAAAEGLPPVEGSG